MDEKWFNLITQHQDQCKEQTVAPTFLAQCSFHWSILRPRLKINPYLLKVFPLKTACHHPTCSRLPLPTVLGAGVSTWALHNLQKAESTYFLNADQTVFTFTLQLAKLWVKSTIGISTTTSSNVEGRIRVPVCNLSNCLLSWCLSFVSDTVTFFHSGSHKTCGSDKKSYQWIFKKFLIWATPSCEF